MDTSSLLLRRRRRPPETAGLALGLGSLGIGMAGLVAPGVLGRLMRMDRSAVWVIAVRDLASAWLLLGGGGRLAYLTRGMFDLGDAVLMRRRRPLLALLALGASMVGFARGMSRDD